jgi:hypothetical protein
MDSAFIYSLAVGFVGAVLFLTVDKYEKDQTTTNLLKLLVVVVSSVAIMHRLKSFGIAWF